MISMRHTCFGVRSRTCDGLHAILIDFDGRSLRSIRKALTNQMRKRRHGDYFIIQNELKDGHYHAYCPTKVAGDEYLQILDEVESDPNFTIPLTKWLTPTTILRFHSPTKGSMKYLSTLKSIHRNEKEMSSAHLKYLNLVFNIRITPYTNTDKSTLKDLKFDVYKTSKK